MPGFPFRVLIVDPTPAVRLAVWSQCRELVPNGSEIIDKSPTELYGDGADVTAFDLTVMDIFELSDPQQQVHLKKKCRRRLGCLVALADFSEPKYLWEIPHWDVQGVVDKQESLTELYSCLKRLVSGRGNVAADLNRVFCGRFAHANLPHANLWCTEFTKRELEVLTWVGRGLDRKAIADRLHISIRTVDRHRQNIMDKTDIRSELGLSHLAFRWGIH